MGDEKTHSDDVDDVVIDTSVTFKCNEDPGPLDAAAAWNLLASHAHTNWSRCIPAIAARAFLDGWVQG